MTRYLLDTTALIDFSKGREPARSWILESIAAGEELGVCPINVAEFYSGVPTEVRVPEWDEFMDSLAYWQISREAARQAGRYRYEFARKGVALATADVLVAAVAVDRAAVLVTNNVRHYPMDDIHLLPLTV